ncbi:flagellar operon protein [Oceanobacillus limi]|uniref:Flagellar operon protein n=1 Tax=Oceanobacillus limi TaxID=930131 RepID=A0A1H9Z141_9BACI|nr:TIGR02530 family flagellar biosynthesis protein [Oceanobacillus limi]SES75217.1 flagellar operon protein [Oceanobacillus limi]
MDHRIHQVSQQHALQIPTGRKPIDNQHTSDFKEILIGQQALKFSKHASQRLNERNIEFNEKQWETISEKVLEAKQKGITDSLVVTNNAALVVSTKNNTVVTAMDREEATSNIFSNINGTILIND